MADVKIGVGLNSQEFDTQVKALEQKMNGMASVIAQNVGKTLEKIVLKSQADITRLENHVNSYLKMNTEVAGRMRQQGVSSPLDLTQGQWNKMYPSWTTRNAKMEQMYSYFGVGFKGAGTPPPPPRQGVPAKELPVNQPPALSPPGTGNNVPPRPVPPAPTPAAGGAGAGAGGGGGNNPWIGAGRQIWGATGPIGGVAGNALSGMLGGGGLMAGASAGLAGLVGGLGAMLVGKLVGSVMQHIQQSETNAITIDRIVRLTGDRMNFRGMRNNLYSVGNALGVNVSDMTRLAQGYASAGYRGDEAGLGQALLTSGGFARSFGTDMGETGNMFASMRGANLIKSDSDARKLGLVIGETAAKAGGFFKMSELMQTMFSYSINQSRQSLSMPDTALYGGRLAALMATGNPGLDLQGSANILNRADAAIQQGGGMGSASEQLLRRIAKRYGLTAGQLSALKAGGINATMSNMLGAKSSYGRYTGNPREGDTPLLEMVLGEIRNDSSLSAEDKAEAVKNFFKLESPQQAAELLNSNPLSTMASVKRLNRLGIDFSTINQTGIRDITALEGEKASDVYSRLKSTTLNPEQSAALEKAKASGNDEILKNVAAAIIAQNGQEATEGSKTRDSIAQVESAVTALTDKIYPTLTDIRLASMKAAGMSEEDMRTMPQRMKNDAAISAINSQFDPQIEKARDEVTRLTNSRGLMPADEREKQLTAAVKTVEDLKRDKELALKQQAITSDLDATMAGATGGTSSTNLNLNAIASGEVGITEPQSQFATGTGRRGRDMTVGEGYTTLGFNNPGNLTAKTPKGQPLRFQTFTTPDAGVLAMANQLRRYQASGKNTIRKIITSYDVGNPKYIKYLSDKLGVGPDDEIDFVHNPQLFQQLMNGMIQMEGSDKSLAKYGQYVPGAVASDEYKIPQADINRINANKQTTVNGNVTFDPLHINIDANGQRTQATANPKFSPMYGAR
ncbi:hypothetical protein EAN04_24455 [Salmonella enterica]|nr:hypothetical protein [Salmonella enterica]